MSLKYRPEGWDDLKAEVMGEISERVNADPDAMTVADSIFEMAGDAMLKLIREKNCGTATCESGFVYAIFPSVKPDKKPRKVQCPFGYKMKELYTGPGMVGFIPDDRKILTAGR